MSDPAVLSSVNADPSLGLSSEQIAGISSVLGTLGHLLISEQLLSDLGAALCSPESLQSFLLFCTAFGQGDTLAAVNDAGDLGLSEDQIAHAAIELQSIAGFSAYQDQLLGVFAVMARVIHPTVVFSFFGEMGNVPALSALNADYELGLSEAQIARVSGALASLGTLSMSDSLVKRIAMALCSMPALEWLNLSGNQIIDVTPLLVGLSGLSTLRLANNRLDLNSTSPNTSGIAALQRRGVSVDYDPQNGTNINGSHDPDTYYIRTDSGGTDVQVFRNTSLDGEPSWHVSAGRVRRPLHRQR